MTFFYRKSSGVFMLLVILFLATSCNPKYFPSVSPARNKCKIYLHFDPLVPALVQQTVYDEFAAFTASTANRPVKFVEADTPEEADIVMNVKEFRPVTPGQSAAGVVVSLIGLSLPMIMAASETPIIIFFYYFPKSKSYVEIHGENHAGPSTLTHRLLGPGFLLSEEKQQLRHLRAYRNYFSAMQRQYEKELRKGLRKR